MEWGHGLVEGLAADRLEVVLDVDVETEHRSATVLGVGGRWRERPDVLAPLGGSPC